MHSPRVLGLVALAAIGVACVSFAVVDVTVAHGCSGTSCSGGIPVVAVVFAALGGLAALVAVIPAISWAVKALREAARHDPETDRELARAVRARGAGADDEL